MKNTKRRMYRLTHLVLVVFLIAGLNLLANSAYGQNQPKGARYYAARKVLNDQGYDIIEDRFCDLSQGLTAYFYKTYYATTEYKIIAICDDVDVSDVDVYVYYDDGTIFTKDTDIDAVAIVSFTPSIDRYLKVVFKNYASRTPNYASTLRLLVGYRLH